MDKFKGLELFDNTLTLAPGQTKERVPLLALDAEQEQILTVDLDGCPIEDGVALVRHVLKRDDRIVFPSSEQVSALPLYHG